MGAFNPAAGCGQTDASVDRRPDEQRADSTAREVLQGVVWPARGGVCPRGRELAFDGIGRELELFFSRLGYRCVGFSSGENRPLYMTLAVIPLIGLQVHMGPTRPRLFIWAILPLRPGAARLRDSLLCQAPLPTSGAGATPLF